MISRKIKCFPPINGKFINRVENFRKMLGRAQKRQRKNWKDPMLATILNFQNGLLKATKASSILFTYHLRLFIDQWGRPF